MKNEHDLDHFALGETEANNISKSFLVSLLRLYYNRILCSFVALETRELHKSFVGIEYCSKRERYI
jgi:hypothetical protein